MPRVRFIETNKNNPSTQTPKKDKEKPKEKKETEEIKETPPQLTKFQQLVNRVKQLPGATMALEIPW